MVSFCPKFDTEFLSRSRSSRLETLPPTHAGITGYGTWDKRNKMSPRDVYRLIGVHCNLLAEGQLSLGPIPAFCPHLSYDITNSFIHFHFACHWSVLSFTSLRPPWKDKILFQIQKFKFKFLFWLFSQGRSIYGLLHGCVSLYAVRACWVHHAKRASTQWDVCL